MEAQQVDLAHPTPQPCEPQSLLEPDRHPGRPAGMVLAQGRPHLAEEP